MPLTSTGKSSLFIHAHSSPLSLAASLHPCQANHSHYINNGWTFSRQTSYVHTKTCTWMFTAALFIIARSRKQLQCPPVGEWINTLWYLQTMDYSVLKRNELPSYEKIQRKLHCYYLVEEASLKGYILYDSSYTIFWKMQNYSNSEKISGCRGVWMGGGNGQIRGAERISRAVKILCMIL